MADDWDDEALIQKIRSGDERLINDAVKEIFLKGRVYIAKIVNIGGGTEEEIQDILDDAALEVVTKVQNGYYRPEKMELERFFRMIGRNRWKDKLKKKYRKKDHEGLPGEDYFSQQHTHQIPADKKLAQSETNEEMARALQKLPPKCRKLLRDYWYKKIPLHVLAEQLRISKDALKQRHLRCKEKLKDLLGRDPRIN